MTLAKRLLAGGSLLLLPGCAPLATSADLASTPEQAEAAAPSAYSAEDEALYQQRFRDLVASFATGVGLDTYDPTVPVAGAPANPLPIASAEARTISAAGLADALAYAEQNNTSAFIVWRHGAIEAEHYFGDTQPDTLLNSRSFAKPLTAIVIGRALQMGAIASLDQPVADFIPQWRDDPLKAQMLVRHLLDMRTGLLPQAVAFSPDHILNRAYLHPRHIEVIVNDYPMVGAPGVRYDYSNATSELVAPVIEAATGRSYEDFVGAEVLTRIGAHGGELWINRVGGMAHSGCCILLPARDWLRLSVLLLNNGAWQGAQLLPPGFVEEMRKGTPQNPYYGMGVWVAGDYIQERGVANPDLGEYTTYHGEPYAADDLYLFDGNANQVSYIVPSEELVVLRMGASPPKGTRWDNSVLPNLIIRAITAKPGSSTRQRIIP